MKEAIVTSYKEEIKKKNASFILFFPSFPFSLAPPLLLLFLKKNNLAFFSCDSRQFSFFLACKIKKKEKEMH